MTISYGSIGLIKFRLKMDSTLTTYDSAMTLALTEACAIIDNKLRQYTTIVPATVDTEMLGYIAGDYGAGIFKARQIPTSVRLTESQRSAEEFISDGDSKLSDYVKTYYLKSSFYFVEANSTIGATIDYVAQA